MVASSISVTGTAMLVALLAIMLAALLVALLLVLLASLLVALLAKVLLSTAFFLKKCFIPSHGDTPRNID